MRSLLLALLCLPLLAACQTVASSRVTAGDDEGAEAAKLTPDQRCLDNIAKARKYNCKDRPATLPEGWAVKARARWAELDGSCSGTRAWRALRALDECIAELETEPTQIDNETKARRDAQRERVAPLRGDAEFQKILKKRQDLVAEADAAADEWRNAKRDGADADTVRFRRETWDQAEQQLRDATDALKKALKDRDIDSRDARQFNLW